MKTGIDRRSFFFGLAMGVFLFAALTVGSGLNLYDKASKGFTVELPAGDVAHLVAIKVRQQVDAQIPRLLARVRAEIPARMAGEVNGRLQNVEISFAGRTFKLPVEVRSEIESKVTAAVKGSVEEIIDGLDASTLSAELAGQTEVMVRGSLVSEFREKTFVYQPWPWVSLPVTIKIR